MKRSCAFTVPGNPTGKQRPRFNRSTGKAYTPAKTAKYENLVTLSFINSYPTWEPIESAVTCNMIAYFEIPKSYSKKKRQEALSGELRPTKKPDTDNIAKIKDALNGIVWRDDSQVVSETITKYYSETPRLEIEVKEI